MTDAAGQVTTLTYSSAGEPLSIINAKGEATAFLYTSTGRVSQVTTRRADVPKEAAAPEANGENGAGNGSHADAAHLHHAAQPAGAPPQPVAVPETAALPQGGRKGRLVDRITGLGKT